MDILTFLLSNVDREINQKDVVEEFQIRNPTVSGLLDRLEGKGYIVRSIGKTDGRLRRIEITGATREIEAQIHGKGQQFEERLLHGFTPEEKAQLIDLLQRILRNLKESSAGPMREVCQPEHSLSS
jgi:DNA-binding MarR family transcriptional regulator